MTFFSDFFLLRLRGEDVPLRPGSSGCVEDVDNKNWIQMQKRLQHHFFFCFSTDFFGADENVKAEKDEVTITIVFSKNNLLGPWFLGWLNDS